MNQERSEALLANWRKRVELAEAMLPMIGRMYRDYGVVIIVYGRPLINRSPIDIIKAHRFVRQVERTELSILETFPLMEAMSELKLASARIDLGKLAVQYIRSGRKRSPERFVREQLADLVDAEGPVLSSPQDVALFGFGRIGRLLARLLIERTGGGDKLRLRAIVVRPGKGDDLFKRASLLRRDSIHGSFHGSIQIEQETNSLIINGNLVPVIFANAPDEPDYTKYGADNAIIIDNTGKWKDEEGLGRHLACPGASRVVLTAPGKGKVKNIVFGVNDSEIGPEDKILSAASCTTNAITPVLKAINDEYEIVHGHVETVHAYTNDQNLIDNYHASDRRGRSAPLNMVITSTGAAKAVAKALPELAGKLTGNAIRVPIPNVSLAILNLNLDREVTSDSLNEYLRNVALFSDLQKQIDYSSSPEIVSSDLIGSRYASVVDSQATIASGRNCVVYVWYDNEFGYSAQVLRIVQKMAGIQFPTYPKETATVAR